MKKIIYFITIAAFISQVHAQMGQLTIISTPSGANIFIDNTSYAKTPLYKQSLSPGYHTVQVIHPTNNSRIDTSVHIIADSLTLLNVSLGKSFGTLVVTTKPKGASVQLVTNLGKSPLQGTQLIPGAYIVNVEHPMRMYKPKQQNIFIYENDTQEVTIKFEKNRRYIVKKSILIGLGILSAGAYTWGYYSSKNDNTAGAAVGISLGTVFLVCVELFSFL